MGIWDTVKGVAGDIYNTAAAPFRTGGALGPARPIEDPDPMTPERAAAMRQNFLYGGSETGAADFNAETGAIADQYGQALVDQGAAAGQRSGDLTRAGMNAFGADPNRYVDPAALAAARGAAGNVSDVGNTLLGMANQPAGPSVAEAQLRAGQAQLENQNLALATSGRGLGGGAAARRAAIAQNAQASGGMNAQLSTLRATEETQRRQRQQEAAGAAGQAFAAAGGLQTGIGSQVIGARDAAEGAATQRGLGLAGLGENYAGLATDATHAGAGVELQGQQVQNAANIAALQGTMGQEENATDRRGQEYGAAQATQDSNTRRQGAWLGLLGTGVTALGALSDRRAKRDVERVEAPIEVMAPGGSQQTSEAEAFANRLRALRAPEAPDRAPGGSTPTPAQAAETIRRTPAYSFRYKDPERHGDGERLGVMAQDLEKTPAGAQAVERDSEGLRHLDTGELTTINTAALHNVQERQDELDERLRKFASMVKPPDIEALDRAHERERSFGR